MAKLLLELLSEEIPSRMQRQAAEELRRLVERGLTGGGLPFSVTRALVGPRRVAVAVDGLPRQRPDQEEGRRGPRVGAPDNAIQGFLKSAGLNSIDQAERRATDKGEFWFVVSRRKGGPTVEMLPQILVGAIRGMIWPKSMKWGTGTFSWVRPLHSILAVFDGQTLSGELDLGGGMASLRFSNRTRGHRFLSEGEIVVEGAGNYVRQLRAAKVVVDQTERNAIIRAKVETLTLQSGLALRADDGLIEEVAGLVEWPVPLLGTIDPDFMDLPTEVLITSMRTHQRYLATYKQDGCIANKFVVIANMIPVEGSSAIVAGNERVLRARLADARFFWDQDRKIRLRDRLPALKDIVFHARLGSQHDRVERIRSLAREIIARERGGYFAHVDAAHVDEAARLCKADLVSGMVGEFPELQGTMGSYYALHEGLADATARAIAEHYAPQGPSDRCPTAPASVAVALADKLDMLIALWSVGEKPTGSKDPFGLRRAALGVIRLIVENRLRLGLSTLFRPAPGAANREPDVQRQVATLTPEAVSELEQFLAERLKVQVREQGVRHDLVTAVFAHGDEDDLVRLLARVQALQHFVGTADGKNLLIAYNRAANIVGAEKKKDIHLAERLAATFETELLQAQEERVLAVSLAEADSRASAALAAEDFGAAMSALAALRGPIDSFFDRVTVNSDDDSLRLNRLKLLDRIRATVDSVADCSKIEG